MAGLLRRLNDMSKWAELADSKFWDKKDCPPELLTQIYDQRGGISVYQVDDVKDVNRVIAATSLNWGTIRDYAYTVISESDQKKLGLKLQDEKSNTFDS